MKEKVSFGEKLTKLIDVKSIVTLLLIGVACYGFVVKTVPIELFGGWVSMILGFFFAKNVKK